MEIGTLTHESRTPRAAFDHGLGMDKRLRFMTELIEPLCVEPGTEVKLSRDHDPGYTGGVARPQAAALHANGVDLLIDYQDRLAAQPAPWAGGPRASYPPTPVGSVGQHQLSDGAAGGRGADVTA